MSDNTEALRDTIGQAIADKLAEWSEDGKVTFDPFDSRNIDEIADAAVAALAQQAATPTDSYVQPVPDKCDRIVWRGAYYSLPLAASRQAATPAPAEPTEEVQALRQLLAITFSGRALYTDDGEMQDNLRHPYIDFLRDSPRALYEKMSARRRSEIAEATWSAAPPATPAAPPAAQAEPPTGWRLVLVNDKFDALMTALDRAARKGYMPDAMAEEWEAFDYNDDAAPTPAAQAGDALPPDRVREVRAGLMAAAREDVLSNESRMVIGRAIAMLGEAASHEAGNAAGETFDVWRARFIAESDHMPTLRDAWFAALAARGQAGDDDRTQAAQDVLSERRRQVEAEGWTPEHDDEHSESEMALAAACYAMSAGGYAKGLTPPIWPWSLDWWKPAYGRRDLVKAGALILAEIERMDRAARGAA